MREPVELPVERRLVSLSVRLAHGLRACLPLRWWRARFGGNPLLERELGLAGGRPWWRSKIALAAGTVALAELIHGACRIAGVFRNHPTPLGGAVTLFRAVAPLVPLWLVACAWAREPDDSLREELGVTRLTALQLLAARTTLWCLVLIGGTVLEQLSRTAYVCVLWAQPDGAPVARPGLSALLNRTAVDTLSGILAALALTGAVTRLALRRWPPAANAGVVAGVLIALDLVHLASVPRLISLLGPDGFFRLYEWSGVLSLVMWGAVASVCWRGLRLRVARAYGFEPRD